MAAKQGEHHHKARLTPEMVMTARALHREGLSFAALIEHYGHVVDEKTIRSAVRGTTWKHLPGATPLTIE